MKIGKFWDDNTPHVIAMRKTVARERMFPDAPLGNPVKKFEDTFSGEQVVLDHFFSRPAKTK